MIPLFVLALALTPNKALPSETKVVDLKDGFVRLETKKYVIELPKGWEIGEETRFGQREISGKGGEFGVMTGSSAGRSWDDLYRVSLYFIQRDTPGKATPYKLSKSKQGYDAMSFEIAKEDPKNGDSTVAKYVIFRNKDAEILALSVKVPTGIKSGDVEKAFERLINTAKML